MEFDEVYLPREDTYLLESALKKIDLKNKKVLEIGCGSGYLSIYCALHNANITAIDINPKALQYASNEAKKANVKINFIISDLFKALNKQDKYDIIIFNPPYLVSDKIEYLALDGGKEGREIIDKFLTEFDKHLTDNGFVLLLHTDYNDLKETEEKLAKKSFRFEIVAKQHIFFEDLYILRIFKK